MAETTGVGREVGDIEQIRKGDDVLATDPTTGHTRAETVTDLITGTGQKRLTTLVIDTDGPAGNQTDTITATDHHPFWVPDTGIWTDAVDLTPGTRLHTPTGTDATVTTVSTRTAEQTVYNLTVANAHTYHVLAGTTPLLVHNAKKNKCSLEIDHVGQVHQDWVHKGAHVNMKDGMEVALRPDGKGGIRGESIRLRKGTATQKQVDAVVATIKSDPKTRADMIRVTKAAKEVFESSAKAMKEGRTPQWRFSNDRTDELQALIKAMEKM
ncbi:HINT domain-containing protein [Streptomyces sp. BV333]|uniref:polymorphic toxin-type HINT domain-containing protein n=1 Tax=Streptomyces sp. BV333 TaxID=2849673 RepID=UPI001C2F00AF|nr:polymorphic toxin-type HINT domain-containing protein [Streptomyces sp. BV333]MBV1957238.1 HINT domain-containing protein [Streptomyces sp. BV333]